jgi:NAD-dependent dihydropyrimidine dehydrogenase PreA subunit
VIYKKWEHLFDADPRTCGAQIMVDKKVPVVRTDRCQGCSNCVMACPLNQRLDNQIIEGEAPKSDNVVLRVKNGTCRILNAKLCAEKGFECKRCEEICPRRAIRVTGILS